MRRTHPSTTGFEPRRARRARPMVPRSAGPMTGGKWLLTALTMVVACSQTVEGRRSDRASSDGAIAGGAGGTSPSSAETDRQQDTPHTGKPTDEETSGVGATNDPSDSEAPSNGSSSQEQDDASDDPPSDDDPPVGDDADEEDNAENPADDDDDPPDDDPPDDEDDPPNDEDDPPDDDEEADPEACLPSGPEICDGKDNDCDGAVDEDDAGGKLTEACGCSGNEGKKTCSNGSFGSCDALGQASCDAEVGLDRDCDGTEDRLQEGAEGSVAYYRDDDRDGFATGERDAKLLCPTETAWQSVLEGGATVSYIKGSERVSSAEDCCDKDAHVMPVSPEDSFSSASKTKCAADDADASNDWDYDCDGQSSTTLNETFECALLGSWNPGWMDEIPACGQSGDYGDEQAACLPTSVTTREQLCR